jgi:hypothetical protein
MNTAEYQAKYRASKGARTGAHGPKPTAPCGTVAAYRRHQRNNEPIDQACREANNAAHRAMYARRKGKP